ncbi:uncharacterized protein LOC127853175 [Dreissena polymorpha]|nr:uncharacterized protein LOC127853175 [Dreissena polymorpha]
MPTVSNMMAPAAISTLQVRGEAAPKGILSALSANSKVGRTLATSSLDKSFQFVLNNNDPESDVHPLTSVNGPTVPVRKMEHLSRVRTANYGISTMDDNGIGIEEHHHTFVIEKPHFVLCGLPVGSKEIDHHLYMNEARVGNFKTSAQALYRARREPRSGKTMTEHSFSMSPDKGPMNPSPGLPEAEGEITQRTQIPPIPPTTPVNNSQLPAMKSKSAISRLSYESKFTGSIPESDHRLYQSNLAIKHKKMTLLRREKSSERMDLQREHSSVSTQSIKSIETVSESVINNNLTVTTGNGARLVTSGKAPFKTNYNNPYRHTKFKERLSLNGNKRIEFKSIDSYMKYQKQHNINGKHFLTPRAVLRIPKPCSDTFLLQMMHDLNRPKSRKSAGSAHNSLELPRPRDLEDFVQTRTSSSLSKAQSNIDKFMGKSTKDELTGKSIKSAKSAKSATETIEEEEAKDVENIMEDKLET